MEKKGGCYHFIIYLLFIYFDGVVFCWLVKYSISTAYSNDRVNRSIEDDE